MTTKQLTHAISLCAVIGLVLSIYSLLHNAGLTDGTICTLNDTINCDVVNKGPFGKIAGIPVSLIGVIGYAFLLVAAQLKQRNTSDRSLSVFLLLASLGGFAFSLYLTSLEAFVLHAWCLICLTSQLLILIITGLAIRLFISERS
ncbi:MAG: vitamin K epoxide reductase family protein [Patescibacteria group bacterium]